MEARDECGVKGLIGLYVDVNETYARGFTVMHQCRRKYVLFPLAVSRKDCQGII